MNPPLRNLLMFLLGAIIAGLLFFYQCCRPADCSDPSSLDPCERQECLAPEYIEGQFYVYWPDDMACDEVSLSELAKEDRAICEERLEIIESIKAKDIELLRQCGCNLFLFGVPEEDLVEFDGTILATASDVAPTGGGVGINIPLELGFRNSTPPQPVDTPRFKLDVWLQRFLQSIRFRQDLNRVQRLNVVRSADSSNLRLLSTDLPREFVKVAILDMGIDYENSYLDQFIWVNPQPSQLESSCYPDGQGGYNSRLGDGSDVSDMTSHGSHIAGIISMPGLSDPANPYSSYTKEELNNLRLISVKMTEENQTTTDLFSAICAMRYAIAEGADILNLSWGFRTPNGERPEILARVLQEAKDAGILVVTSAGNEGINLGEYPPFYPAAFAGDPAYDNVIAVAALNAAENALEDRSNYGYPYVQIAAPGEDICSFSKDEDQMFTATGTSMAAPFVVRYASMIMMRHPDWDYRAVKDFMLATDNTKSIGEEFYPSRAIPIKGMLLETCAPSTLIPEAPSP